MPATAKPPRLQRLEANSLSLPRNVTTAMRKSIRSNPRKAIWYTPLADDLADAMIKGYQQGYNEDGSTLSRDDRAAKRAEFRRDAGGFLMTYQKNANSELKRAYDKAIRAGKSETQATKETLRRFRTLGMNAPASNGMETTYRTAIYGAYQAGVYDAAQNDQTVKGFRYITQRDERVRVPWHSQLDKMTAPKDSPIWEKYFPPWQYNCRCFVQPLKRTPKGGWSGLPADFQIPPDDGFAGAGFVLI